MALQVLLPLLGMLGAGAAAKLGIDKIQSDQDYENYKKRIGTSMSVLQQLQQGGMTQQMQAPDMSQPYMDTSLVAEPQTQTASAPGKATAMPTQLGPPPRFQQAQAQTAEPQIEEPDPLERPIRFTRPMQVSNVPFNIATGEIGNISMKPDTNAMNAQFMQAYQSAWPDAAAAEGLSDEEAQVKTWMSIGGQLGFFPTDDSMWKQLPEYEKVKEASFWRTVNATMMDQNWVDAVKSQAGGDLSREDLRDNAVYKVSQTAYNGWLPDGMREALQKRAENSPLTPATQERAYAMGFGKGSEVSPQEAAIAHQAANREEIVQSAAKTGAQTGARIGTEFAMEPLRPIPGKTKAQYGLGPGINTWKDLESFGGRLPTAKDREDYQDLIALQQMIDQMEKNLSLIWNSGPDVLSRLKHGASLQWEKAQGTEVGRAIQNYEKIRPLAARRVGAAVERGGRFTDQDQKQFSKSFPELGMMPDSAQVAQSAVENLRELMTGKMKIFRNVLLEPPTSGETTKRKPGETPEEFLIRTGGM